MNHRNAQGLTLGLPRTAAAATGTLTGTLQNPSLLQDLHLNADQLGLVDAIRVANQSVMCSDAGMDLGAFALDAQVEGHRGLGIPLNSQQEVTIDYTLVAAGAIAGGIGIDPLGAGPITPVNDLGPLLNYCAGLGSVDAALTADTDLSATMRRRCVLGLLGFSWEQNVEDLTIRSISVNNIELLAGPNGQTGEVGIQVYGWANTDNDGATLAYPVRVNDDVTVTIHNYNVAASFVYGGIFVLPIPHPDDF